MMRHYQDCATLQDVPLQTIGQQRMRRVGVDRAEHIIQKKDTSPTVDSAS